jgi:hypothetical protein
VQILPLQSAVDAPAQVVVSVNSAKSGDDGEDSLTLQLPMSLALLLPPATAEDYAELLVVDMQDLQQPTLMLVHSFGNAELDELAKSQLLVAFSEGQLKATIGMTYIYRRPI